MTAAKQNRSINFPSCAGDYLIDVYWSESEGWRFETERIVPPVRKVRFATVAKHFGLTPTQLRNKLIEQHEKAVTSFKTIESLLS